MHQFQVHCVDEDTGQESYRVYGAATAVQARRLASEDGFVVGEVAQLASDPSNASPRAIGFRGKYDSPFRSFFAFRTYWTLHSVSLVFGIATVILALYAGWVVVDAVNWFVQSTPRPPLFDFVQRLAGGPVAVLLIWIALRIYLEAIVILFSIHERLREIERRGRM